METASMLSALKGDKLKDSSQWRDLCNPNNDEAYRPKALKEPREPKYPLDTDPEAKKDSLRDVVLEFDTPYNRLVYLKTRFAQSYRIIQSSISGNWLVRSITVSTTASAKGVFLHLEAKNDSRKLKEDVPFEKRLYPYAKERESLENRESSTSRPGIEKIDLRNYRKIVKYTGKRSPIKPRKYLLFKLGNWILDTGSSVYIYNKRSWFVNIILARETLATGDGGIVVIRRRTVKLTGADPIIGQEKTITLSNTYYVPRFYINLVSYARLREKGSKWSKAKGVLGTTVGEGFNGTMPTTLNQIPKIVEGVTIDIKKVVAKVYEIYNIGRSNRQVSRKLIGRSFGRFSRASIDLSLLRRRNPVSLGYNNLPIKAFHYNNKASAGRVLERSLTSDGIVVYHSLPKYLEINRYAERDEVRKNFATSKAIPKVNLSNIRLYGSLAYYRIKKKVKLVRDTVFDKSRRYSTDFQHFYFSAEKPSYTASRQGVYDIPSSQRFEPISVLLGVFPSSRGRDAGNIGQGPALGGLASDLGSPKGPLAPRELALRDINGDLDKANIISRPRRRLVKRDDTFAYATIEEPPAFLYTFAAALYAEKPIRRYRDDLPNPPKY
ncbi:uncharacterized protein N7511_008589 [Penicillium nucicola]|uniref:uncharacterized protein n=1 Tax=Penicillium nucicola TaxID=1850975 RepID=UPI002544E4BA|nr:uncharacterized protein N7511_008589 [Penicillium nucicola]KAJ5746893.1 hypothetical protein N7511_008589 [Penicillium nucicola]